MTKYTSQALVKYVKTPESSTREARMESDIPSTIIDKCIPMVPVQSKTLSDTTSIYSSDRFPWEILPFDMREAIFAEIHESTPAEPYFTWRGSMPALIIALRPLKLSYGHVMRWFERANPCLVVTRHTGYDISDMNQRELNLIKEMSIDIK